MTIEKNKFQIDFPMLLFVAISVRERWQITMLETLRNLMVAQQARHNVSNRQLSIGSKLKMLTRGPHTHHAPHITSAVPPSIRVHVLVNELYPNFDVLGATSMLFLDNSLPTASADYYDDVARTKMLNYAQSSNFGVEDLDLLLANDIQLAQLIDRSYQPTSSSHLISNDPPAIPISEDLGVCDDPMTPLYNASPTHNSTAVMEDPSSVDSETLQLSKSESSNIFDTDMIESPPSALMASLSMNDLPLSIDSGLYEEEDLLDTNVAGSSSAWGVKDELCEEILSDRDIKTNEETEEPLSLGLGDSQLPEREEDIADWISGIDTETFSRLLDDLPDDIDVKLEALDDLPDDIDVKLEALDDDVSSHMTEENVLEFCFADEKSVDVSTIKKESDKQKIRQPSSFDVNCNESQTDNSARSLSTNGSSVTVFNGSRHSQASFGSEPASYTDDSCVSYNSGQASSRRPRASCSHRSAGGGSLARQSKMSQRSQDWYRSGSSTSRRRITSHNATNFDVGSVSSSRSCTSDNSHLEDDFSCSSAVSSYSGASGSTSSAHLRPSSSRIQDLSRSHTTSGSSYGASASTMSAEAQSRRDIFLKDVALLDRLRVPFSYSEVVSSSNDVFRQMRASPGLSDAQLAGMLDARRRATNRKAAERCRQQKNLERDDLVCRLEDIQDNKKDIERMLKKSRNRRDRARDSLIAQRQELFSGLRNSSNQPLDPELWRLQFTEQGRFVLVQRELGSLSPPSSSTTAITRTTS